MNGVEERKDFIITYHAFGRDKSSTFDEYDTTNRFLENETKLNLVNSLAGRNCSLLIFH